MINANEHGNGTALFTRSGPAARKFQNEVDVGMVSGRLFSSEPFLWGGRLCKALLYEGVRSCCFITPCASFKPASCKLPSVQCTEGCMEAPPPSEPCLDCTR